MAQPFRERSAVAVKDAVNAEENLQIDELVGRILNRDASVLSLAVRAGAHGARGELGMTPLQAAVAVLWAPAVKMLVANGADVRGTLEFLCSAGIDNAINAFDAAARGVEAFVEIMQVLIVAGVVWLPSPLPTGYEPAAWCMALALNLARQKGYEEAEALLRKIITTRGIRIVR